MTTPSLMAVFIDRLNALADAEASQAEMLREVPLAMKSLLMDRTWLPPDLAAPHPEHYQQYLLYCDPIGRFSIVSFVWGPGQQTPIHDHTVWGVVGQLKGQETSTNYEWSDGKLIVKGVDTLNVGETVAFSPEGGDIHQVKNDSAEVSVSIHVYGGDIGRIERHRFDAATGATAPFVSGYAPAPLPDFRI